MAFRFAVSKSALSAAARMLWQANTMKIKNATGTEWLLQLFNSVTPNNQFTITQIFLQDTQEWPRNTSSLDCPHASSMN